MTTDEMMVDTSQDWVMACDVQQRFMQGLGQTRGFVDYCARCRQVRVLGGDCYDFMPIADDHLAWVVGDASGKGLAAALMIANVQSSLRAAALFTGSDLAALFKVVNHLAYASSLADRYASLFYGVFEGGPRILRYVNAGHCPPVVLRRDGPLLWLEAGGPPVGMFPDYDYQMKSIALEPGDLVIAYTDGVVEAANPAGEEWGVEGLLQVASRARRETHAEDLVQRLFESMDDFSQGSQSDDATLAVVRVI